MSYFSAFLSGINYGFNPLAIATSLLFFLFLSFVGKTRKRVIIIGLFFIILTIITKVFLALGVIRVVDDASYLIKMICRLNFVIALGFLFLGVLHFIDWKKYQANKDGSSFLLKKAVFLLDQKDQKDTFWKIVIIIFVSIFLGVFLTVLGSIWPEDEYYVMLFSSLLAQGDLKFVILSFIIYFFATVLPLIFVCIGIYGVLSFTKIRDILIKAVSKIKIISSAIFLSTGFGLGFVILKMLI